jgi:2-hydroxy-6-oxonona-2,4-dienedioate hydrolase
MLSNRRHVRNTMMIGFAFLVIAAVAIGALFVRDLSHARARLEGRSQTISTSLGDMEYALLGQGAPALVIHGAGGGFDQALDMIGPLADDGYQLIAPSRFGYLRSVSPANYTNSMQADAYAELLDRLGVHKADVIAISAGAWSALQFAIRHPDRCQALVLLIPAANMPPQKSGTAFVRAMFRSDFVAWATIKLLPILPAAVTRRILGSDPALVRAAEPSEQARTRRILDHVLPVSSRTAGMEFDIRSATVPEPYATEKISCPVLTVSAADDAFGTNVRAQFIAAGVPDGRAVIYPTGGHALVGHFTDVRREIVSFLGGLKEKR